MVVLPVSNSSSLTRSRILLTGHCSYVFASVGWGPGVALYIVFGAAASFSGWMIWTVFLGLDSSRFPMQSFGDTYYRVYGAKSRHFINVTQAIQQFMTVSVLILGSATTIAQLSNESICFVVCMIIVMVIGMALGSVRSLQRLGWLCNLSVWLNIVSFLIMYVGKLTPLLFADRCLVAWSPARITASIIPSSTMLT
jgi:amino acid permease